VYYAADDAAIVDPLDASHVRWQMRFDPFPLLVVSQNRFLPMIPTPFPKRIRIVLSGQKN
jgi:hypothetical protein